MAQARLTVDIFEVLDALASDRLIALTNYGDRWGIKHRTPSGEEGEIIDDHLDRLIETWMRLVDMWDAD